MPEEIDHSVVMDTITRAKGYWNRKEEKGKLKMREREEVLGLKFRQGEKVIDTVTGEEVEVIGGTREIVAFHGPGSTGG